MWFASFPFSIQFFKVLGYYLSTNMCTLPVRAPASCQVPTLSGAQEYELSLAVSLSPPFSSQPHLLSAMAPPTALRSFFIYECILRNPCPSSIAEPGFGLLRLRGHPTLAEVTHTFLLELSVDQFFHQQRKHTLVIRVKMATFNTHHHRPLRRVYDFRPKTTRNIPRCVLHVLPKCEASISGQEAFPSVT